MTEAWHKFPDPGIIPQADGSTYQWQNCAPTTWAMLIVSQQQGKWPGQGHPWWPTGASLRRETGDTSGGIAPGQLDTAVNREYGLDLEVRIATMSAVQAALDGGYAVGILIDYSPIAAAGMSGSPGFYGSHSIAALGTRTVGTRTQWLSGDPLYDGRRSGIPKGPQWIDRDVMVKAAGMLDLGNGTTVRQRYGPGHLYAVFTTKPYTPPPPIVEDAPATAAQKEYRMIAPAWRVESGKVMRVQPGQPFYKYPGGPRVTKLGGTVAKSLAYIGPAGKGWAMVLIGTGVPYSDKKTRPTGVYVPAAAGPVTDR